jgi:hypothetical protein
MLAQDAERATDDHPIVGSWIVAVEIEGEPPLLLPNLASFTADGVMTVAAPVLLPELPGDNATRDLFSAGHGAWTAGGERSATVRFAFLVVADQGNPASINVVDGELRVDESGDAYEGEFTLTILAAGVQDNAPTTGTWKAARITPGEGPMPMPMDAVATPAA